MLPVDLARAGAITSANRIGVSSGTRISRGVWALRANRRRDSVANAVAIDPEGRRADGRRDTELGMVVTAVIGISNQAAEIRRRKSGGANQAAQIRQQGSRRSAAGRRRRVWGGEWLQTWCRP